MIIRLRGKLIEQSEAGKCLVIGTIMADCLIIKQQKILVFQFLNMHNKKGEPLHQLELKWLLT